METKMVELSEAQGQAAALVAQAASGAEIVLVEGTPRARLVALAPLGSQRVAGLHPGSMEAVADFDAPLSDEFCLVAA